MNTTPITYPVHECFHTFQGEGVHTGRRAFFIRLFGCPVHCPWCDSAGTWHPEYIPKADDLQRMTVEDLVNLALGAEAPIVVITGGEPAIHNLEPLCRGLHARGFRVHLETSGAFAIHGLFHWITLSPKKWKLPLTDNVLQASEFKIIVETPEDIQFYHQKLQELGLSTFWEKRPIWLHPEWSQRDNTAVLGAISNAIKKSTTENFRAGWQLHKLYKVDLADSRSRPPVPLGGNPQLGM